VSSVATAHAARDRSEWAANGWLEAPAATETIPGRLLALNQERGGSTQN